MSVRTIDKYMRQLKIIKQVTNRKSKSLDKYLQDISKIIPKIKVNDINGFIY